MVAPRAAAWIAGLGLAGLLTSTALATGLVGDVAPPDLPEVVVTVEGSTRPATAQADEPALPPLPEVTVTIEPAPPAVPSPTVVDIAPPDLPAVVVSVPLPDPVVTALQARLTGEAFTLLPRLGKRQHEALAAFYALGGFHPVWIEDGAWTPRAKAVIARLKSAGEDALDPADYPVPVLGVTKADSPADLAEADLTLSAAAALYARDARGGRIEPARISRHLTPDLNLPDADALLTALAGAADPGAALSAHNPPHAGYQTLRRKLAEIRAGRPSARRTVQVPAGRTLRVGMRDPRVPLVRARFGLQPVKGDETAYDERVASAVADFQREKGLAASGVLDRRTVAALGSGPSTARLEGELIANMERWRWLPRDLGRRHVFVNVPDYRLQLMESGAAIHQARVIVGKAETPTPIFSDAMEHLIVNPYWTVPPSILKKEFLPAMAADPFYAEQRGYEVIRRGDRITVRQPPGERNALGFIKFMFPNDHAVYLHDTPNRRLFGAARRAFSHGCVRVDQPFRLAEFVLASEPGWSEERLKKLIGKGERMVKLKEALPVHLAYFTVEVDAAGTLRTHDDIYGLNAKIRAALDAGG